MTTISAATPGFIIPGVPTSGADTAGSSGDHLADMNGAMTTMASVNLRAGDRAGIATVLGASTSYLNGARSTAAKLEEGIRTRLESLAELEQINPAAAEKEREQLELMSRLVDRIHLSIERITKILHDPEKEAKRVEELESLERRRQLLAPQFEADTQVHAPNIVAGAYLAARGV